MTTMKQLRTKYVIWGLVLFIFSYLLGCATYACWECGPVAKYSYYDSQNKCDFGRDFPIALAAVAKMIAAVLTGVGAIIGISMFFVGAFCPGDLEGDLRNIRKREKKSLHLRRNKI
jgi:hypothetical protein